MVCSWFSSALAASELELARDEDPACLLFAPRMPEHTVAGGSTDEFDGIMDDARSGKHGDGVEWWRGAGTSDVEAERDL